MSKTTKIARNGGGGVFCIVLLLAISFLSCSTESDDSDDDIVAVESITISKKNATISVDEELTLTASVTPEDATDKTVVWQTSDETKATVKNGKVKGIAETENGKAVTITASAGEKSATCAIMVIELKVQDKSSDILPSGKALADDAFTGIDSAVATIEKTSDGKINITPKKANGETIVTVKYSDNTEEVFTITITNGAVSVAKSNAPLPNPPIPEEFEEKTLSPAVEGGVLSLPEGAVWAEEVTDEQKSVALNEITNIELFSTDNSTHYVEIDNTDSGIAIKSIRPGSETVVFSDGENSVYVTVTVKDDGTMEFATPVAEEPQEPDIQEFPGDFVSRTAYFSMEGEKLEIYGDIDGGFSWADGVTEEQKETGLNTFNIVSTEGAAVEIIENATVKSIQPGQATIKFDKNYYEDKSFYVTVTVKDDGSMEFGAVAKYREKLMKMAIDGGESEEVDLGTLEFAPGKTYFFEGTFQRRDDYSDVLKKIPKTGDAITLDFSKCDFDPLSRSYGVDNYPQIAPDAKIKKIAFPQGDEMCPSEFAYEGEIWTGTDLIEGESNKTLEEVVFNSDLDNIGPQAFKGCSALKKINLSDTKIRRIYYSAFEDCSSLEGVQFPETIEEIDGLYDCWWHGAFEATGIKSADLSATKIKEMDWTAFKNCAKLESVKMPATLEKLTVHESYGYYGDDFVPLPLKEVDLSATKITEIEARNFSYSDKLTTVKLPPNLEKIGKVAFQSCTSLTQFNFPATLKEIDDMAFQATSLANVDLSGTKITRIGDSAFAGGFYNNISDTLIHTITQVKLPDTLEELGNSAFNQQLLAEIDLSKTKVTQINESVFKMCENLSKVVLNSATTIIKTWAFSGCKKLSTLTLPNTLTEIGEQAFSTCESLSTLNFPPSLEKIEERAFMFSGLSSADLSLTKVTEILGYTFYNCKSLATVRFPATLKKIFAGSFYMTGVTSVDLSNIGVTDIGLQREPAWNPNGDHLCDDEGNWVYEDKYDYEMPENGAFEDCAALATFKFPATLKQFGYKTFSGCKELVAADISRTAVKEVPGSAFAGCYKLSSVLFPVQLNSIAAYAFTGCASLEELDISATAITEIYGAAFADDLDYYNDESGWKCFHLKKIALPVALKKIGDHAFYNAGYLEEIDLSQTQVEEIGDYAFTLNMSELGHSDLKSIKFPATLKKIGEYAFRGIKEATIDLSMTQITEIAPYTFASSFITGIDLSALQITQIGEGAFAMSNVETVKLPNAIEKIGESAFQSCHYLKSINFPASLKEIGPDAFRNSACATGGVAVTIDLSQTQIKEIPSSAFACSSDFSPACIATVIFPDCLEKIGYAAFFNSGVTSVDLSRTKVTEIAKLAFGFYYRHNLNTYGTLTSVKLPATLTTIHAAAFQRSKLVQIDLSNTAISKIYSEAFGGSKSLTDVILPTGATIEFNVPDQDEYDDTVWSRNNSFCECTSLTDATKASLKAAGWSDEAMTDED